MVIRFHPEADIEFHKALAEYGRKKDGLDKEFMMCVDEAISRIKRHPELYPVALKNIRKSLAKRFPYILFYIIGDDEIMILSVFHAKRDPNIWKRRILGK